MTINNFPRLPDPNARWFDPKTGKPLPEVYQYLKRLDQALREAIQIVNANH